MPANASAARNLLLSSDYPMDKVVWKYEATYNVPQTVTSADVFFASIPHGLGYMPIVLGVYTADNWASRFELGSADDDFGAVVEITSTDILFIAASYNGPAQFKVRMFAMAPLNVGVQTIANPISNNDPFILDTDDNYMKLFRSGVEPVNAVFADNTFVVAHSLGYVPSALVYIESTVNGRMYRSGNENAIGVSGVYTSSVLTADTLRVTYSVDFDHELKIHYRIYLDE